MTVVLDARDRRLARLFAACVMGRFDVVRDVRAAAPSGEPDRAWRETLLQVHVFAGVPRAVECYTLLAECGAAGGQPGVAVIGLPGNPRSALVVFRLIGMPLIRLVGGCAHPPPDP